MSNHIEYNGHVIEPTTQLKDNSNGWTLEVRITAAGHQTGRRCRAPNTYASQDVAVAHCLEFGRRIVDGKLKPKIDPTN
jgi:hypothetical protein